VLVAVCVMAAGCVSQGRYAQEQDIQIVKISSDGTVSWNTTIDHGNDEEMRDIVEMDDGSFIIAGGSSPIKDCTGYSTPEPPGYIPIPRDAQLIGLSDSGEIRWLRNYSINGNWGMISVFKNSDQTLDALSAMGELWHLQSDGSVIRHRPVNITQISSAVRTRDGGYFIVSDDNIASLTGSNITKLDPEGNVQWQLWFNESQFTGITQAVELPEKHGYLFGATYDNATSGKFQIFIIRLSPGGVLLNNSSVDQVPSLFYGYSLHSRPEEYIFVYAHNSPSDSSKTLVKISESGSIISSDTLDNSAGYFIPTNDEGFLSIDNAVQKIDKNGNIQWKNTGWISGRVEKAIQTTDGGFVIMTATKKMSKC